MYNSFELFFFWRKYSTVVAVGVQTSFLPCGWIGLLLFLRNEKKQCANCGLIAKSVTEKNNSGLIVRKQTKRPCKPRGTRGGDFWRLGILPCGAARNELSGKA
ncbi:MAG: hypothetical protein LLF95_06385 [Bacteroidales bacterium]|nr:hypothetical protein [Bacteroidales bacterium]